MDIKEATKKRDELNTKLVYLLAGFEIETGLRIEYILFERDPNRAWTEPYLVEDETRWMGVRVNVKLP